jgi:hypothetical protein
MLSPQEGGQHQHDDSRHCESNKRIGYTRLVFWQIELSKWQVIANKALTHYQAATSNR